MAGFRRMLDPIFWWIDNHTPLWFSLKKGRRTIRHLHQILTRGWPDSDLWNLDYTVASFLVPRLKRFKETTMGHPVDLTEEEWNIALDKMIFSFENYSKNEYAVGEPLNQIDEGLRLFALYFYHLWS